MHFLLLADVKTKLTFKVVLYLVVRCKGELQRLTYSKDSL